MYSCGHNLKGEAVPEYDALLPERRMPLSSGLCPKCVSDKWITQMAVEEDNAMVNVGIPLEACGLAETTWPTYGGIQRSDWNIKMRGEWPVDWIDKETGRHILTGKDGETGLCGGSGVCKWCIEEGRR